MPNHIKLPAFARKHIHLVIETPRGSAAKFSYEPEGRFFRLSHPLPAGITYPYDWGFIPSTLGDDGDPLDGLLIHEAACPPGLVIKCEVLGSLRVQQSEDGEQFRNDRFLLCPIKEDAEDEDEVAGGISGKLKREIEQFFQASVLNSGKKVKFKGWQNAKEARKAIKKGQKMFARRQANGK
jgi:inorganic pyrophosphatase